MLKKGVWNEILKKKVNTIGYAVFTDSCDEKTMMIMTRSNLWL